MMIHHAGEELWYLLRVFHGMGYVALFIVAMIWARLLLEVILDAIAPMRKHPHKFVHPLPSPSDRKTFEQHDKPS
jgi:hypothetical protein